MATYMVAENDDFIMKNDDSIMKNDVFIMKNDDFIMNNDVFIMKNDDFIMNNDDFMMKHWYVFLIFFKKIEMLKYIVGHEESDSGHHLGHKLQKYQHFGQFWKKNPPTNKILYT